MKRKRYTEEQIIGFLKAHEAGTNLADLVREHDFSEQSFYRWRSKFGGMEVSEAKRLKGLEAENTRPCLKSKQLDTMQNSQSNWAPCGGKVSRRPLPERLPAVSGALND